MLASRHTKKFASAKKQKGRAAPRRDLTNLLQVCNVSIVNAKFNELTFQGGWDVRLELFQQFISVRSSSLFELVQHYRT
jgi:hypothetical protein